MDSLDCRQEGGSKKDTECENELIKRIFQKFDGDGRGLIRKDVLWRVLARVLGDNALVQSIKDQVDRDLMPSGGEDALIAYADFIQWCFAPKWAPCLQFAQRHVAVLVSDMSGFSSLTRKHGIVHLASVITRLRQLCFPILHELDALHVSTEADNIICIFPSALNAVLAAHRMQKAIARHNAGLLAEQAHFALSLGGIGLDYGLGPILDTHGKMRGTTFSNAYHIGEECCEGGVVLLSGNVHKQVEAAPEFAAAQFCRQEFSSEKARSVSEEVSGIFEFKMESSARVIDLPPLTDDRFIGTQLLPFASRHSQELSSDALRSLDADISSRHLQRRAVLMFEFEFLGAEGPEAQMALQFDCMRRMRAALRRYPDHSELEDELHIFEDPVNAVLAALQCRRLCGKCPCGPGAAGSSSVVVRGFGVHLGDLLLVDGTDVHWGDPVNTASKLGQDTADGGEILITKDTHEAIRSDARVNNLTFKWTEVKKSGILMECCYVSEG